MKYKIIRWQMEATANGVAYANNIPSDPYKAFTFGYADTERAAFDWMLDALNDGGQCG